MEENQDPDFNNKMTQIKALIEMAKADDYYSQAEEALILHFARKMGLSEYDVAQAEVHPEDVTRSLPKSEEERMTFMYQILFLMKIDLVITEEEMNMCRQLGFRLGIRPALIDDLINVMINHINDKAPKEELLNTLRPYLN